MIQRLKLLQMSTFSHSPTIQQLSSYGSDLSLSAPGPTARLPLCSASASRHFPPSAFTPLPPSPTPCPPIWIKPQPLPTRGTRGDGRTRRGDAGGPAATGSYSPTQPLPSDDRWSLFFLSQNHRRRTSPALASGKRQIDAGPLWLTFMGAPPWPPPDP
jgi:hypothetical protein